METGRYYIIGGRGYIGSILRSLISRESYGGSTTSTSTELDNFLRLRLDVPQDYANLPITEGDVVFLTAAISAPDICANEYDRAWAVNVTGTSAFIDTVIARGGRVIFFSSDTVYGEYRDEFDEHAACNPAGEYAVMKHEVERRFGGTPSFKAIRLSYVFSYEDKFTKYILGCAERGEEAELFHPFFRAIIHRNDVVDGVLALARRWNGFPQPILNFGGPEVLSRIDFVDCLREVVLPNLKYRVVEPADDFFRNRPRIIAMKSSILPELLGRPCRTLKEAASIEFNKFNE